MATMELRVGNKYFIGRKIGSGSFGDVYLGKNNNNGKEVAIKLESVNAEHLQLKHENDVYKSLAGVDGIPSVCFFGTECDYNAMVLSLLGPSLEDLFDFCKRRFTLKTVLRLFDQIIRRIKSIHAKFFIHRDIEPNNFLMGIGKRGNQVNVIDFGLAKKYLDPDTHSHIPYGKNEQSRRDDLQSLGYLMIYFLRGDIHGRGYDQAVEMMKNSTIKDLCSGLPDEFATYLNYTRLLKFEDEPNYPYLREIFRGLYTRKGFRYDDEFDWTVLQYEKNRQANNQADSDVNHINKATAGLSIHGGPDNGDVVGRCRTLDW